MADRACRPNARCVPQDDLRRKVTESQILPHFGVDTLPREAARPAAPRWRRKRIWGGHTRVQGRCPTPVVSSAELILTWVHSAVSPPTCAARRRAAAALSLSVSRLRESRVRRPEWRKTESERRLSDRVREREYSQYGRRLAYFTGTHKSQLRSQSVKVRVR